MSSADSYRVKRPYHRSPIDTIRHVQLGMQTTQTIDRALQAEAAKRGMAKSRLAHDVLAAVQARNLWADLLDSESQSVASVSPQNEG